MTSSQDYTDRNRMDRMFMMVDSKCVMVTEDLKLCAVDRQVNEPWVQIKERTIEETNEEKKKEKKVLLALLFLYNEGHYYAKVDGNDVVLEKADGGPVSDNDSIWFMKVRSGFDDHYGLQSMVDQRKYLSCSEDRPHHVILGDMIHFHFSRKQARA